MGTSDSSEAFILSLRMAAMRPFLDITKARPRGILTHVPNFMAFVSLECLTRLRHDLPALSSDAAKAVDANAGDEGRLDQCSRSARR
ncbi:hypothetical protein NKJ55_32180, partial [Mesorhizobium sp. M0106]|uniref:hypothetical protein n=1 Tax=Mesorhizobium sp. M0106 TaxID=2956880 RepID=UPI00333B1F12